MCVFFSLVVFLSLSASICGNSLRVCVAVLLRWLVESAIFRSKRTNKLIQRRNFWAHTTGCGVAKMYRILFISASVFRHFFVHCSACTSDEQHHLVKSGLAMSTQWYVGIWLNRLLFSLSLYQSFDTHGFSTSDKLSNENLMVDETLHANLRSHRCVVFVRSSGFRVKFVVCTYARNWRKQHV